MGKEKEAEDMLKQTEQPNSSKRTLRKEQLAWDKLDNTANLFPVIATEEMSNVYRISVTLTEEIDRVLLQEALNRILPQFSVFRMRLRMGVFWYYFEENTRPAPIVREEYSHPGAYIDKSRNNHYMFRVTYYKCRINLEVFHVLTDGSGGIIFLKELIYQYLRLKYPDILKVDKDKISSGVFLDKEDSYVKNFKKGHEKVYKSERALTLNGEELPKGEMGVIHGYLPVEQLKEVSKRYGVTINQYLVGTFVYAIYKEYLKGQPSKVPIRCCVPVNLRPYYNSHTMKNFFAMVSATFKPEKEEYTFEEVLQIVATDLKEQITPENLDNIMSYNVSNEQNLILRAVPLFIKNFVMKQVYEASAKATSATVTNIGNIELKEPYRQYVENFYVTLSMSEGQNMKGGICSYNGILTLTFSSVLVDLSIQKQVFQTIAKDGVSVAIESNGAYYEEMSLAEPGMYAEGSIRRNHHGANGDVNKCENCNIIVYDDAEVCPLCHSVLDEMSEDEKKQEAERFGNGAPYPDVRKRAKRLSFVTRLILFLFILAEIGLVIINHFTTPGIWWSGISGVAMIYIYLSMIYWINHDSGYAAKVGLQLTLTMLLLYGIDYFTGMSGWSLKWAIPGVILFGDAIVFFLMMLNRQHWYSYTLLLLLIALFSVGIIYLYFVGKITNVVLPVTCAGVTGVYLLGTIIFGDRELKRELKRRFHV